MNIPLPAGFAPPPDAEVGGDFDAVVTFTLTDEGTLTLKAIDGAPVDMPHKEKPKGMGMGMDEEDSMMNRAMKKFGPTKY